MQGEKTQEERNAIAKLKMETMELWLRNLLVSMLGHFFAKAQHDNGDYFVADEKLRFNLQVLNPSEEIKLVEVISIIFSKNNYNNKFKAVFENDYPFDNAYEIIEHKIRLLLSAYLPVLNAENISSKDYDRIVCYTSDIIDPIKEYYQKNNLHLDYNIPSFIRITDLNTGQSWQRHEIPIFSMNGVNITEGSAYYPGDVIMLQVDVDSSFSPDDYTLEWKSSSAGIMGSGHILTYELTENNISTNMVINCSLIQNKEWHKFNIYDDNISVHCKVLPLID